MEVDIPLPFLFPTYVFFYFTVPSHYLKLNLLISRSGMEQGARQLSMNPLLLACRIICLRASCRCAREPGSLKKSDAVYFLEIFEKVICCHEKSPQKCSLSCCLAQRQIWSHSFYSFGAESLVKHSGQFLHRACRTVAAGAFQVILLRRSACSSPLSLTSLSALFSAFLSATVAQCHVHYLNRVSDIYIFPVFCVASGGAVGCCLACQPGCERAVGVEEAAASGASSFTRVPASQGLPPSPHGAHPAGKPFTAVLLQTHPSISLPLPPVQSNAKF